MLESLNDLWRILAETSAIFLILFLIYRKHIFHLFDPLLFYLVAQSFTIELAFIVIDNIQYLINFLGCELCFIIGFLFAAGKPLQKNNFKASALFKTPDVFEISVLKWYAIFGFIILLIANIIFIKVNGLIILADNPSAAKVESYTSGNGLGIVRRMNFGLLYFVGISIAAMFLIKNRFKYIILLVILVLIIATSGSKGALFYFIILIAFLSSFTDIRKSLSFKKLKVASSLILILAIFLIAILISSGSTDDTFQDKLFKLVTRFLFFGDSIIYYYHNSTITYFSHYNIKDFFIDEFNSILGLFRLTTYSQPLGFRLMNFYYNINQDTFGPNIPYYIKGNIYFGYYGAFIYSFIVGCVVGFIRRLFYSLVRNGSPSLIYALFIIHININVTTFAQDSQLYINQLSDTLFLSMPILFVSLLLHYILKRSDIHNSNIQNFKLNNAF